MTSPAQVASNFASMLFLLRDQPEARQEHAASFKQLYAALGERGIDFRVEPAGLRVYDEPVSDALPMIGALRTHLLDRGVGELRLPPLTSPAALLAVMRALVHPPGFHRSLHELTSSLDAGVRDGLVIAPPAPGSVEISGDWSVYGAMSPEVARRAESLRRPAADGDPGQLTRVLGAIDAAPDDPAVAEQLNEVVLLADDHAARGDWVGVLRAAAGLVRAERRAKEGTYGRAYGIAIRRMLPRSTLEQVARLLATAEHRSDALPVLQRMGADATETLLSLLASAARSDERRAYFGALRQMTEGTELLVNMLTHDEWYVVRNVADLCGELRIEASVARLARHVNHRDERVRRSVALALVKIGTAATVEPLRQMLRDPSPGVRLQLLQAADGRRNRALAMSIAVLLDDEARPEILREMLLALGRIGSSEAVQVLMRASEPGGRLFNRKPMAVRLAAIEGLERAGGSVAAGALRALLHDADAEIRHAAQRAVSALSLP